MAALHNNRSFPCPHCQEPLSKGVVFCDRCGLHVADAAPTQQMSKEPIPHPERDSFIGRIINGKYQIVGLLGKGAFGSVYKAKDLKIERDVAIKFLHKHYLSDDAARRRFLREAKTVGTIKHPNVVVIYDVDETDDDEVFLVMELVEGNTLRELLKTNRRLPINRAVALMFEICEGVGAVHEKSVLHRDLKPDNVIVCSEEKGFERVKVLDFGLAKLRATSGPDSSQSGILGTPLYMSPEALRGLPVDASSDVFSLAAVLYEMIVGALPQSTSPTTIWQERETPPPFLKQLGVPASLQRVIIQALSKTPELRPRNANEFSRKILEATTNPVPPIPNPIGPTLPSRFDFAIVTVLADEHEAIRRVLELDARYPTSSIHGSYFWGKIDIGGGRYADVVHGATSSNERDAGDLVREMIEIFDPDFILILGCAVAIEFRGKLGQIVYSRTVRSTFKSRSVPHRLDEFEEASNLPPDEILIKIADRVAEKDVWREVLKKKKIRPPRGGTNSLSRVKAQKTEIFSGPDGHQPFGAPVFKIIQSCYPKVDAVDLEGSATVVQALLQSLQKGRSIGYLAIKGIADFVGDHENDKERRQRREAWASYASAASAAFAHSLIKRWSPGTRRHHNIPAKYLEHLDSSVLRNTRALVVHHLHPEKYSELCMEVSRSGVNKIFAICGFEPNYFARKLTDAARRPPEELGEAEFLEMVDSVFPHFGAFRKLAEAGMSVTRIVLAEDSYELWKERNAESIALFKRLNGNVDCYVSEVLRLRNDHLVYHTTDHVVFNSNLWLDYYHDSQTMIMSYEESGPMHNEFTTFEKHFREHKHVPGIYKPLNDAEV
ncbi:MAG TPA: serine/threonine-protein kinase [Pyrinomonadaceae bacterium]|nr:serine/threonine-protein kinase [Pyrinomonadaceae bacterium]